MNEGDETGTPRPARSGEKSKAARGLGRGLSALFGEEKEEVAPKNLRTVATELLRPGRFQPRRSFDAAALESLTESVRQQGILQPILVRRLPEDPNSYEILAGERRWRAAQAAKLHEVPIILREMDDRGASEVALIENIQRQDLNPVEEAEGYRRLIEEFGHTQDELGRALGKSRSHIANTLRLLSLPAEVQAMIVDGSLTAGHARALVTAREPLALAKEIARNGMSVRQVELAVRAEHDRLAGPKTAPPAKQGKDANVAALEKELTQKLGLKVTVATEGEGGVLSIRYRTLDQLDEVLALLRQHA
jgi:ParB family transcriptional regulator, chromosome partitioning protein